MKRTILTGLLLITIVSCTRATTLTFAERATVRGNQVTLGDVARIDGTTAEQAQLGSIVLDNAPVIGQSAQLTPGAVRVRLRQHGFDPAKLTISCPNTIQVTRLSATVGGESVLAIAQAWLQTQLAPGEGDVVKLVPLRTLNDLTLPEGTVTWECNEAGADGGSVRDVTVTARIDGQSVWQRTLSFRLQRTARVLVATRQIARGTALNATCVSCKQQDISTLNGQPLHDLAELDGHRASTFMPAGTVLTTDHIEIIPVVKCNDPLHIHAHCGAMDIDVLAVACQDGVIGDTIRVRNIATHQEFLARVNGPGELEFAF